VNLLEVDATMVVVAIPDKAIPIDAYGLVTEEKRCENDSKRFVAPTR
jgi:hypothetical protein